MGEVSRTGLKMGYKFPFTPDWGTGVSGVSLGVYPQKRNVRECWNEMSVKAGVKREG